MPIDVALPASFHSEKFLGTLDAARTDNLPGSPGRFSPEAKSGNMILISPNGRRHDVQVKVYMTSLEHFAVIYPQKKVCKPLGVINLRNTSVERLSDGPKQGFYLRQKGYDTTEVLTFHVEELCELDSWMAVFTSRASPTILQTTLPAVMEDDEY